MTQTFRTHVKLPPEIADFLAQFTGPGAVQYGGGDTFQFTFDVEGDMWEAAEVIHDIERNTASLGHPVKMDKPTHISTGPRIPNQGK